MPGKPCRTILQGPIGTSRQWRTPITDNAETVHVSDYDTRDEEEHIKVREQPAAGLAALPRDPKRQEPQQPRRIQRDGDIRLRASANHNQQQYPRLNSLDSQANRLGVVQKAFVCQYVGCAEP